MKSGIDRQILVNAGHFQIFNIVDPHGLIDRLALPNKTLAVVAESNKALGFGKRIVIAFQHF